MKDIDYSVIIRTIGKANEKYQMLLDSISSLDPLPKEVIVVLPEGYDEPVQKLGWETFYYSKKGMVEQRVFGIKQCKTKYALICDDDVSFEADFVCKLAKPLFEGMGSFSIGPLYSFLPPKGVNTLINVLMGSAAPTLFHKNNYCTILNSTGYSFNRNLKTNKQYYFTESAAWTCFFMKVEDFKKIDFDAEFWLDKNGYSALDDTTMFYKSHLMGYKTVVVPDATYIHTDAKTSIIGISDNVSYSLSFNKVVFWHRFIYSKKKNVITKTCAYICFKYNQFCRTMYLKLRAKENDSSYLFCKKGYKDGYEYLKTEEYSNLRGY